MTSSSHCLLYSTLSFFVVTGTAEPFQVTLVKLVVYLLLKTNY